MRKSLYNILEVSAKASPEIIRNAYRTLASKYHPDNRDTGNEEIFKKLSRAYEILSDPKSRIDYDTRILHNEEDVLVDLNDDASTSKAPQTVKRLDGSDTWCTIDEHVKRKGVELPNTNLKGLLLRNLSLAGGNLTGTNLSNAIIENVDFTAASFANVVCENTTFQNANLSEVKFVKAVFKDCVFKDCKFTSCVIDGTKFLSCDFRGSSLVNGSLKDVDFSNGIMEGVTFSTDFYSLNVMPNVKFTGCNLRGVVMGSLTSKDDKQGPPRLFARKFQNCDFTEANMEGASCKECEFDKCNFAKASLASANFSGTLITAPLSFENTSLFGVDFSESTIGDSDFSTCNVVNARFHGSSRAAVIFPEGFVAPPSVLTAKQQLEVDERKEDRLLWLFLLVAVATLIIIVFFLNFIKGH